MAIYLIPIITALGILIFLILAKHLVQHISREVKAYRKRDRVMNASEQALFINLQHQLQGKFLVLAKVRIEDFVEAVHEGFDEKEVWGNRNRIKSRHIDFLICDFATTKPLLAIELDGNSHNRPDRLRRDSFVNKLYKDIEIRVEHIPVGSNFESEAVKIKDLLVSSSQLN
jgi:hypothetical protein